MHDKQGQLVNSREMKAFGKWSESVNTVKNNFAFAGQYKDNENDNFYNYYRDYSNKTGRYIQSDPIGLKGGVNVFSYARNNPNSWIDPLGLKTAPCDQRSDWEYCKDECGSQGVESCIVHEIIRKPVWIFNPDGTRKLGRQILERNIYCNCFEDDEPFCDGDCTKKIVKKLIYGTGAILLWVCTFGGAYS